ncbi:hypothetical protein ACSBOB_18370 [Mesorhizobium sp. ASY16-5R]|uniref:hypothetical protein n=1 Tax=Mesorhizobium sp. ASY16-5R TaxID=3445772 RepID=UPI003FA148A6
MWRFAWSVFWKTAVAGILFGIVVNVVLSFFLPALLLGFGILPETMVRSVTYLAYAVSAVAYFVTLKFVLESSLGKNIGGIQLDHVSRMRPEEDSLAN